MAGNARHQLILDRLQSAGRVEVADLATELDTAQLTIRRDLDQLEAAGVLRRVRGGAVSLMLRGEGLPYAMRNIDGAEVKARMAGAVADLLTDGEAVAIDSGTTGAAVASALVGRRLTAMPLSLQAIAALSNSDSIELLLPGGAARKPEGSIVGPLAEKTLASLRFDVGVLTCCGFSSSDGVMAHDLQDASVKNALRVASRRTVLVAEGAKFARSAMAVVCSAGDIDVVVTDTTAPTHELDQLRASGIEVIAV